MSEQNTAKLFGEYELGISPADRKIIISGLMEELRKAKGYSQREVADLLAISPQTYNGWEKARNEPPVEYLVRLSYLYNVSLDILCGKSFQQVPTKRNVGEEIAKMRKQILDAESSLREITDEVQRQQLETMLQGMYALLNLMEDANKKNKL